MDAVVGVGGWEHECCGPAIERDQMVDLLCLRVVAADGEVVLSESHHDLGTGDLGTGDLDTRVRVRGRVRDIHVARSGQPPQPVLRLPSGTALRGFDDEDDGHLEDPWTGELLPDGQDFVLVVHVGQAQGAERHSR